MFLRRPVLLLSLLVAAAVLAAGCGSGPLSKKDYQAKVDAIGKKAEAQLNKVISSNTPPTEQNLNDTKKVFASAADELNGLTPPKDIATAHTLMVKGLHELADTFGMLAGKVGKVHTDKERADVFLKAASDPGAKKAFDDLKKAQTLFHNAGYTVFDQATGGGTSTTGATATTPPVTTPPPATPKK